jgi:signal transduction histidine kinase
MCAAVLDHLDTVIVPDASLDERFRDNPFVDGGIGNVRFYASAPLVTSEVGPIGRLCVFDDVARDLDEEQQAALTLLAERVVDALDHRLRRRQLEESLRELTRARDELHRSNEKLTRFAGQISHDLRTPLTAIITNAELLSTEPAIRADSALLPLAEGAVEAGRRMSSMLDEILAHALLGAELVLADVDLGSVLTAVTSDMGPVIRQEGARVLAEDLPTVRGDAQQLYVVLLNLVSNAVKFRRPDVAPTVAVGAEPHDRCWRVWVADNGRGVPDGQQDRLFDLFARAHGSAVPGHGIGLATVRGVIEAHGGTVGLGPSSLGGTTVWFELPR